MKSVTLPSGLVLSGDNPRRYEEQQLLRINGDVVPFEKMPDDRETPEQRHLRGSDVLGGNNDSSDDDRAAISNQNLRFFGLRVQCRNALDARNALVDLR